MIVALLILFLSADSATANWQARILEARRSYEYAPVNALIEELRAATQRDNDPVLATALAETYLAKAELLRIDFEMLPNDAADDRNGLGAAIDAAAKAGLKVCESLPADSETYRLRADLRGTLIRTKYRAKKHRKKMEADARRALRLDPTNARAYATRAKPYLFADDRHGGDIETALDLLQTALDLDSSIESVHLLQAYAFAESGRTEEAVRHYEAILDSNPNCRPANDALREIAEQNGSS